MTCEHRFPYYGVWRSRTPPARATRYTMPQLHFMGSRTSIAHSRHWARPRRQAGQSHFWSRFVGSLPINFPEHTSHFTQSFSAYRLTRVLPRPYSLIGWICIVLGVLRFVASVYLANFAMHATDISHYAGKQGWLISSLLAVGAAIDVVIALSMLWYLTGKKREGLERFVALLSSIHVPNDDTIPIHDSITAVIDKLIEYTISKDPCMIIFNFSSQPFCFCFSYRNGGIYKVPSPACFCNT